MSTSETRVGYVVKRYPRYSETFIVNEILAHEAAGLELVIFALRGPEDTHFQDIIARVRAPVVYLPDRAQKASDLWTLIQSSARRCPGIWQHLDDAAGTEARELAHAVALAGAVTEHGITHLHAHFATSAASVARLASRFSRVPYSFTAHAKDIFHESVDPTDIRNKLTSARSVVTVSDYNVDFLRRTYGRAARSVGRIYNGLDLDRFGFQTRAPQSNRIVAVGRLVEKKGFGYLLDACAVLRNRGVNFECRIIGDGEHRRQLDQHIDRLRLHDRVRLQGPMPQAQVIEAMRDAAVFVAPCVVGEDGNRDGLPTVLLEAMALGTPCIATDVTGIPEIIADGETGLLIGQRDAFGLGHAIERILREPELRDHVRARARRLIEAEFDVRVNAARLRELFRSNAAGWRYAETA